jgi:hypothetical protein
MKKQQLKQPPLKSLHPVSSFSTAKLEAYRKIGTLGLIDSLKPGEPGSLKVQQDGTIMDGHHRIHILRERGIDVDALPRDIQTIIEEKES